MRKSLVAASVPVLVAGSAVLAQTNVDRFGRQLEQIQREQRVLVNSAIPAGQRAFFDYGGYLGFSFFAIDDVEQKMHVLDQSDLVMYTRLNIDNVHEFFFRGRMSYRHFFTGGSFDGGGDETTWPTVEQAYYRFDLARYLGAYASKPTQNNVVFQGGREFVCWANGLVLAQTVDGATVELTAGNTSLLLLGGMTIDDTIDFDSSRPHFDDETRRGMYGAMLSTQVGRHRPFIYGMIERDYNDNDPRTDYYTAPPVVTRYDYNSYYIGLGSNGNIGDRIAYGVEFVYEWGQGLSSSVDELFGPVPQEDEDISAYALDVRMDYLVGDAQRTKYTGEVILASGDDDRMNTSTTFGGNMRGTDDNAFNAWGLLNTGLAFAPVVSNIVSLRVGASTYPFSASSLKRLQVGSDVLFFAKFDMDAPIDERTFNERFLGVEPDLFLNWQITSDITLAMRYGLFFPGSAIKADENPRNFFYMGVTFAF